MTNEVCQHNVRTEDKCPDCEAEGGAFQADVRSGKVPCPICDGEPFRERVAGLEGKLAESSETNQLLLSYRQPHPSCLPPWWQFVRDYLVDLHAGWICSTPEGETPPPFWEAVQHGLRRTGVPRRG